MGVGHSLAGLNDSYTDLLASLNTNDMDLEMTAQTSTELQALIQRVNRAIRDANDVGRNLLLPRDE